MKLLVVTTVAVTLRAFLLPHARYFRKRGWTVDGAAADVSRCESCREVFDETFDIPFSRNPLHLGQLHRAAKAIKTLVTQKGYDVVHVHTPVAAFVTRLALRHLRARGKVKVVYTAHGFHFYRGGPFFSNLLYRALEKRAAGWTDHLFVINEEDCEAACSFLSADRVTCLQGGVGLDLSEYDPRSVTKGEIAALRGEMGLKEGEPLFLMVGEFNANKRQADLIRAFAAMRPGKERPHLAFAGTGPAEEPMRQLARRLGVAERVHFLGFRGDVKALLKAATALILPSQREGLPRCLMEAIVMGAPIIGSDTRGTRDLVRLAGGWLFPVGDVAALAEAMEGAVGASLTPLPDEGVRALFCAEECAGRVFETVASLMKKKIMYIALQSAKRNSLGVLKKISLHAKAMSEAFGEDFLGCHVAGKVELEHRPPFLAETPFFSYHEIHAGGLFDLRKKQVHLLLDVIRKKRPHIVYCRYPLACPISLHFFRGIRKMGAQIITEHQSKELPELLMLGKRAIHLSERLFGKTLLRQVDAVVGVTGEIAAYEKGRAPHLETLCIPNGFDAEAVPLRKAPPSSDELRLLCVASVSRWHGLDRLVRGLAEYEGPLPVKLDIVGEGSESENLKRLCQDLHMGDRVLFHGTKTGAELDAFFDRCHLAVGSLALHRKSLEETAELKLREYCARGIPFFFAGFDPDFGGDFGFALSIPSGESPVAVETIVAFWKDVSKRSDYGPTMRVYAQKHLSWRVKAEKLKDWLAK